MPLYEYTCRDCGRRFEARRAMDDRADAPPCPSCAGDDTTLAISAPFVAGAGSTASTGCCNSSTGGG